MRVIYPLHLRPQLKLRRGSAEAPVSAAVSPWPESDEAKQMRKKETARANRYYRVLAWSHVRRQLNWKGAAATFGLLFVVLRVASAAVLKVLLSADTIVHALPYLDIAFSPSTTPLPPHARYTPLLPVPL